MAEINPNHGFGIDVGGSGIKSAIVDLTTGDLVTERYKTETPQPATPKAIVDAVEHHIEQSGWCGPVGITLPAVIRQQVARSAANIDNQWLGTNVQELFAPVMNSRDFVVINDADAAGLAERDLGEEKGRSGASILLTLGTGIGSAFLYDGVLFPNTELGHMPFGDTEAEIWASSAARKREDLTYKEWARRVDQVLHRYSALFSPDRFIIGGGVSRKFDKWGEYLTVPQEVVPATFENQAGIVGAALAVRDGIKP